MRDVGMSDDSKLAPDVTDPMIKFFFFGHLPIELQKISAEFSALAHYIVTVLPRNPERTVALRKLLEAKECAIRARLYK